MLVKQFVDVIWPEATILTSFALADLANDDAAADDDNEQQPHQQQQQEKRQQQQQEKQQQHQKKQHQQQAGDNKVTPAATVAPATPATADATATATLAPRAAPALRRPAPLASQTEKKARSDRRKAAEAAAVKAAFMAVKCKRLPMTHVNFMIKNKAPAGPAARLPVGPIPALFSAGRPWPAAAYAKLARDYAYGRVLAAPVRLRPRSARQPAAGAAPAPLAAPTVVVAAPWTDKAPQHRSGIFTPVTNKRHGRQSRERVLAARASRDALWGPLLSGGACGPVQLDEGPGPGIAEEPAAEAEADAPPPASALAGALALLPKTLFAPAADECELAYGTCAHGYDFAFARGANVQTGIEHGGFEGLLRAPSRGSIPAALATALVVCFLGAAVVVLAPFGQMAEGHRLARIFFKDPPPSPPPSRPSPPPAR